MDSSGYQLDAATLFTLFFVMIGPLKLLGPFAAGTKEMDPSAIRSLALKANAIAIVTLVVGAFVGRTLLEKWQVGVPALLIAAGVVFFLVSLEMVMTQYHKPHDAAEALTPFNVAFPLVVTPYGMAAVIAILALSRDSQRSMTIVGLAAGVLVLDLVAMMFVRPILKHLGLVLKLLGAILGVLLMAMSVQLVIEGLQLL